MKATITKASNAQKAAIKIAVKQLGIDDADYRDLLWSKFKVKSSVELTAYQAKQLIQHFKSVGFKLVRKPNPQPKITKQEAKAQGAVFMISPRQVDKINVLCSLIKWRREDGYKLWVKKFFKLDVVASEWDAQRVIEGLKKMFENQMKAAHGQDWMFNIYADARINDYIEEYKNSLRK